MRIDSGMQSLLNYGSYRAKEIPSVSVQDVRKQDAELEKQMERIGSASAIANDGAEGGKAPRSADLENISLSFNKEDDFGYIGRDSSLMKLDIQKAISDMQRDSVLEEYQYFVGNGNPITDVQMSTDGIVIPKIPIL